MYTYTPAQYYPNTSSIQNASCPLNKTESQFVFNWKCFDVSGLGILLPS